MVETMKPPNPGSQSAVRMGCRCSILHNNAGQGIFQDAATIEKYGGAIFWYASDCPIHVAIPVTIAGPKKMMRKVKT